MAEFMVEPKDYLPGGRLYGKSNFVVIPPSEDAKPIEDEATGIYYIPGSRAVEAIQTGQGYESLPENIKKLVGGGGAYNPFESAQGYVFDEKTGQLIVQNAPGNFSFLGASFVRLPSGEIVPKARTLSASAEGAFSSGSTSSSSSSSSASSASSASTSAMGVSVDPNKMARQSAYDFLFEQFSQYGLGSLVEDIKGLVESNVSPSEFTIRLRQTPTYKKRFAANDARIKAGLRALSEGEYIALEDQYQNILRNYGLPATYYSKDEIGRQEGFERFISGDVSPAELEDRIQLGVNRIKNAAPEVEQTLRQFYPGITQGDILAYTLDPEKALTDIQRKVQAAEIGAEAVRAGLSQTVGYAEELQRYGVTKETAQQGFQAIAGFLPRASTLGDIYAKQGMGPYTQTTAEQEVFGLPSAAQAATKRRKLTELEQAQFSGQAGVGALARERAGQF
jgi:hypothetical protein